MFIIGIGYLKLPGFMEIEIFFQLSCSSLSRAIKAKEWTFRDFIQGRSATFQVKLFATTVLGRILWEGSFRATKVIHTHLYTTYPTPSHKRIVSSMSWMPQRAQASTGATGIERPQTCLGITLFGSSFCCRCCLFRLRGGLLLASSTDIGLYASILSHLNCVQNHGTKWHHFIWFFKKKDSAVLKVRCSYVATTIINMHL